MAEPGTQPAAASARPAGGGRRLLPAVVLTPILPVLALLMFYFATRPESDWVLVLALGLCATAIAVRLLAALRPRRAK